MFHRYLQTSLILSWTFLCRLESQDQTVVQNLVPSCKTLFLGRVLVLHYLQMALVPGHRSLLEIICGVVKEFTRYPAVGVIQWKRVSSRVTWPECDSGFCAEKIEEVEKIAPGRKFKSWDGLHPPSMCAILLCIWITLESVPNNLIPFHTYIGWHKRMKHFITQWRVY